jgi:hypothetical protein
MEAYDKWEEHYKVILIIPLLTNSIVQYMVFPRQVVVADSIGQDINCHYETQLFIFVITKALTVLDSAIVYFHKLGIPPF